MKINDILDRKGHVVYTINDVAPISEALEKLVSHKIGVLIVLDTTGRIAGILSERDILHASVSSPDGYLKKAVSNFMTTNVLIVEPEDNLDYAENIMTNNRFRHLPVIKEHALVGLVSIGDIVKAQLNESRDENKYLKDYISGYPK